MTHPNRDEEALLRLKPILGPEYALGLRHVLVCAVFSSLLIYFNLLWLWYTDLWGHAAYGRWILNHGRLPDLEPFLPLAASAHVVNYCWLSQTIFAWVERWAGPAGLSNLFAVVMVARSILLARTYQIQTGRLGLAMAGMLAAFGLSWARNAIIRPEIFSALCCAGLLAILASADATSRQKDEAPETPAPKWVWFGVPLVFALWVNLHATILVGLMILGAHAAGRAIEIAWSEFGAFLGRRKGSGTDLEGSGSVLEAFVLDRRLKRWIGLTILAILASFLNPDGPGMYVSAWEMANHPNLRTVNEWQPLTGGSFGGRTVFASWVVLVVIFRASRRPVRPVDAILLLVFSLGVFTSVRMILWYVLVYFYVVMPFAAEIVNRLWPQPAPVPVEPGVIPPGRSFRYSLVCLLVLWCGFALSHLSDGILGADPRPPERLYHPATPVKLAEYLDVHPPEGQIWNSQVLGDWLTWRWYRTYDDSRPPIKLFVNTHMHIVPRQVWVDYQTIGTMRPGWRDLLKAYGVNTLVISKTQHAELVKEIRSSADWTIRYDDPLAVVATRK